MIIWINGPFGVGKTSLVEGLLTRLPTAGVFDPEEVGFMVRNLLPGREKDFQDLPPWRPLVAATAVELYRYHDGRPLLVPMTLLRQDYAEEIFRAIKSQDISLHHLVLHVSTPVLEKRIANHELVADDIALNEKVCKFRASKIPHYENAYRDWLTDGEILDTTNLAPGEVVERALEILSVF